MRTGTKDGLRFFSRMLVGLALLFSLTACTGERKSEIIFTTGFFRNEIFRIGSMSCTTKELNVYLLNAENKYRKTLGESVFNEDVVAVIKDDCLSELSQLMAMDLFAQSKGIILEASDQAKVGQAAKEYFHSLSDADQEALNHITEEEIASLYQERALAQKVYLYTIRNINPEISDDEARTVTLRQICIYKKTADAFDKISKAKEELEEGGDFATVSSHYNEADSDRISVSRGDKNKALEEAAFSLDTGKISEVIETGKAYYLLQCISTFDREQTQKNKAAIVERRRREAFGRQYDSFVQKLPVQRNERLWKSLVLPERGKSTTSSFTEVFDTYFPMNVQTKEEAGQTIFEGMNSGGEA